MAPVNNPLVVELVARGFCEGQEILNVTHWQIGGAGAWTPAEMVTLGQAYADYWNSNIQALTIAGYTMTEIVMTQLSTGGFQVVSSAGLPQSGSALGDGLPLNVAACVTLATGRAGRSGRGRYYHGCLSEAATIGSRFTPAFKAAVNAAFFDMRSLSLGGASSTYELVVYSTITGKAPRALGLATPVTSLYLRDDVVDSQRRRLPGRGR